MNQLLYIALGLVTGVFAGMFGIGGGTIMIPALVFLFGLTQHQAQGTTLAVITFPVALFAALRYYYSGNVKWGMVGFICFGFLIGGLIGAHFIQRVPDQMLKKLFGVYLLFIALKMILGR